MTGTNEFSDVLSPDITVEEISALEFEFDDFVLRRELHHWEINFESEEGEEGIVVEREDFVNGKLEFDIDGRKKEFLLEDFDRIEKFVYENGLIS
jgi:hypothetical protein